MYLCSGSKTHTILNSYLCECVKVRGSHKKVGGKRTCIICNLPWLCALFQRQAILGTSEPQTGCCTTSVF